MDISIKEAFLNAMVARASYADIRSEDDIKFIGENYPFQSKMTASMADYFVSHFSFYESYLDSDDGYDGVIFQRMEDGVSTNQYVLGNRGTQFDISADYISATLEDLKQDGMLAFLGANTQISSMVDLVRRMPSDAIIDVAGHSLGGFLTLWAGILFNDRVRSAYTYNGAGIIDGKEKMAYINATLFEAGKETINPGIFANYITAEYPSATATLGEHFTPSIPVNIDDGYAATTMGHGIIAQTDALLVAYVLSTLDDTLDMPAINRMVESLSHKGTLDRNATIAYLGELLGYSVDTFRKDNDNEADLQQTAFDILSLTEERSGGGDLNARVVDLTALNRQQIADLAMAQNDNGLLMRYALDKLSSFSLSNVTGNKPAALNRLLTEEDSGYRMVDASTGKGDLSRSWVISMEISGSDYGDTKESSPNGQPPCSRQRPGYQWATELLNDAGLDDHHRRRVNVPRCTSLAKSFLQRVFASFLSASKKEVARKRRRRGAEAFSESMKACLPAQGWC